jgi:poly(glycerol-phosphate) alpha-glucosyltransferase
VAARSGVRLDVFGDGDRMDAVRAAIPAGTGHRIRLHGHRPDARRRLPRASFLLQTAASEGFPLVLAEAMAAGTLPIAYDVPYGPADLIDDGWNGMLVPSGDEAALAAAVTRLASMPAPRIARMRRAARKTARDYTERAVVDAWATAFDLALERRAEGASSDQASTRSSSSFAARTQPRSASSSRSAARASLTEANSNEPEATRAPVASAMR